MSAPRSITAYTGQENNGMPANDDTAQIESMLPDVIECLKEAGCHREYVKFHELVKDRRFPLSNTAFLLFLDVVQWFGCTTTTQMRYKDEVRRFWRTGYRLFKGKFLNFMAGHKNVGQVVTGTTEKGSYEPSSSKINFAVPDVKYLRGGKKIPRQALMTIF